MRRRRSSASIALGALFTALVSCGVDSTGTPVTPNGTPDSGRADAAGGTDGARSDADGDSDVPIDAATEEAAAPACTPASCASGICKDDGCEPVVFVTSTTRTGALGADATQALANADAICMAAAATIPRTPLTTFRAWLGTTGTSVAMRFVKSARAYRLLDVGRSVVANGFAGLAVDLLHRIDIDEKGSPLQGFGVWTGSNRDGTLAADRCDDWTSEGAQGARGDTGLLTASWSYDTSSSCDGLRHFYCFEQLP